MNWIFISLLLLIPVAKPLAKEIPVETIRPIQSEDVKVIITDFCPPWSTKEDFTKTWENFFRQHEAHIRTVAVVEKGGEIAGYGSLLRQSECPYFKNIPEINTLWIGEKYRGQGLGTKLIGWLEQLAKKEGYVNIGIGVGLYEDYGAAQKLYHKLGFKSIGHAVTYKGEPVKPGEKYPMDDELIFRMSKELSDRMEESEYVTLVVSVPESHAQAVREAMGRAGAGQWGNYSHCSFSIKGVGRFMPVSGSNPFLGQEGVLEETIEERIETTCHKALLDQVLEAIKKAHPYEETVIDIYPIYEKGKKLS
jgi:GNAT superfamily N-acetyltransferase